MVSTIIYFVMNKNYNNLYQKYTVSLSPFNADGHDLRQYTDVQELTIPYDIKEGDTIFVVIKKDGQCISNIEPYSNENDSPKIVNKDELAYTTNISFNSDYGVL